MKCICIRDCYIRHESERPVHYMRGDVVEFDELPDYFLSVEGAVKPKKAAEKPGMSGVPLGEPTDEFDFESAPEDVLMVAEYEIGDLIKYAKENYGVTIRKSDNRASVVAKFVDARYRNAMKLAGLSDTPL